MNIKYKRNALANSIYVVFASVAIATEPYIGLLSFAIVGFGVLALIAAEKRTYSKFFNNNGFLIFIVTALLVAPFIDIGVDMFIANDALAYFVRMLPLSLFSVDIYHKYIIRKDSIAPRP